MTGYTADRAWTTSGRHFIALSTRLGAADSSIMGVSIVANTVRRRMEVDPSPRPAHARYATKSGSI